MTPGSWTVQRLTELPDFFLVKGAPGGQRSGAYLGHKHLFPALKTQLLGFNIS
jgi:hypothetical protein